jgi:hypothetical protein
LGCNLHTDNIIHLMGEIEKEGNLCH